MKKKSVIFYCITLMLFCQCPLSVGAISESKKSAIFENCNTIKDNLKNVQRFDSRTRVFLGSHYETVLSKFVTPLNLRLVENNLSDIDLLESQNNIAAKKTVFASDFINYQRELEELIGMDCRDDAEKFYEKLLIVREKRRAVMEDVVGLRSLVNKNFLLTSNLRGKLK